MTAICIRCGGIVLACCAAFPAGMGAGAAEPSGVPGPNEAKGYLLSYFTGNGEDGLHLAVSRDGIEWSVPNDRSYLHPKVGGKLMRDPSIVEGPDGTFQMVWTTGWWERNIGYAASKDLIHWSEQRTIPVMEHEPRARNSWAPELFYDAATKKYLIVWSSTVPGRFPETAGSSESQLNHRMYYTTTADFVQFGPTRLFYNPGYSVIDGFIARDEDRYLLFYKDERRYPSAKKVILMATSDKAEGPYTEPAAPIIPRDWIEGPSAIRLADRWIVYFDCYSKGIYGAAVSTDLGQWNDITEKLRFPGRARHGTILRVGADVIETLEAARREEP